MLSLGNYFRDNLDSGNTTDHIVVQVSKEEESEGLSVSSEKGEFFDV